MNFVQLAAVRALRGVGCRVFLPLKPPQPGSVWSPTRGDAAPRAVFEVTPTHVTYEHATMRGREITVQSWHSWRQQSRAKCGSDAA